MEREEKSKKVAKEKRSVKKAKTSALPAKEIPAAPIAVVPAVVKTPAVKAAKRPVSSLEQVQLRAYFIGERRKNLGTPGDETSDWVQAELELKAELKTQ